MNSENIHALRSYIGEHLEGVYDNYYFCATIHA